MWVTLKYNIKKKINFSVYFKRENKAGHIFSYRDEYCRNNTIYYYVYYNVTGWTVGPNILTVEDVFRVATR